MHRDPPPFWHILKPKADSVFDGCIAYATFLRSWRLVPAMMCALAQGKHSNYRFPIACLECLAFLVHTECCTGRRPNERGSGWAPCPGMSFENREPSMRSCPAQAPAATQEDRKVCGRAYSPGGYQPAHGRWWAQQDSNPQSTGYEPAAFTVMLCAHTGSPWHQGELSAFG